MTRWSMPAAVSSPTWSTARRSTSSDSPARSASSDRQLVGLAGGHGQVTGGGRRGEETDQVGGHARPGPGRATRSGSAGPPGRSVRLPARPCAATATSRRRRHQGTSRRMPSPASAASPACAGLERRRATPSASVGVAGSVVAAHRAPSGADWATTAAPAHGAARRRRHSSVGRARRRCAPSGPQPCGPGRRWSRFVPRRVAAARPLGPLGRTRRARAGRTEQVLGVAEVVAPRLVARLARRGSARPRTELRRRSARDGRVAVVVAEHARGHAHEHHAQRGGTEALEQLGGALGGRAGGAAGAAGRAPRRRPW